MTRRTVIGTIGGALAAMTVDAQTKRQYYEIRRYQLRNGVTNAMPTSKPAGLEGPFGAFNPVVGEGSPFLTMLFTYSSFADAEKIDAKLGTYKGFIRYERTILRAFEAMPELKLPPKQLLNVHPSLFNPLLKCHIIYASTLITLGYLLDIISTRMVR